MALRVLNEGGTWASSGPHEPETLSVMAETHAAN